MTSPHASSSTHTTGGGAPGGPNDVPNSASGATPPSASKGLGEKPMISGAQYATRTAFERRAPSCSASVWLSPTPAGACSRTSVYVCVSTSDGARVTPFHTGRSSPSAMSRLAKFAPCAWRGERAARGGSRHAEKTRAEGAPWEARGDATASPAGRGADRMRVPPRRCNRSTPPSTTALADRRRSARAHCADRQRTRRLRRRR